MKGFAFLIIAVASVAAKGSGPYLPSGWKPEGPAFYLPSEIVKPSKNVIPDVVLDGSEASGSDTLREYGPPAISSQNVLEQNPAENPTADLDSSDSSGSSDSSEASGSDFLREYGPPVLSENIVNQGLPDVVTEQNFSFEEKSSQSAVPEATVEVSSEQEVVTESAEQTTLALNIDLLIIDDKEIKSQTIVQSTEVSPSVTQFENVPSEENVYVSEISEAVAQTTESASQEETVRGTISDSSVQNIPDIIAGLENGITSEQVEFRNLNTPTVSGSLEQAPEGFLEYGPPGFTEYGPPKGKLVSIENNAARRRRFSPKFRSSKKH